MISTPDERPPLLKGHISDAKGVASQEGFHCIYKHICTCIYYVFFFFILAQPNQDRQPVEDMKKAQKDGLFVSQVVKDDETEDEEDADEAAEDEDAEEGDEDEEEEEEEAGDDAEVSLKVTQYQSDFLDTIF